MDGMVDAVRGSITRQIAPGDKRGDAAAAASNIHSGKGGAGGSGESRTKIEGGLKLLT
jgi:hypothetical protein